MASRLHATNKQRFIEYEAKQDIAVWSFYSNWLIKVMLLQYFLIRKFPNFREGERKVHIPRKFDSSELCFLIEDENYDYDYYVSPK